MDENKTINSTYNKSSSLLGISLYLAACVALLPQIYTIFKAKHANQISLIFVGFSLISAILWVIWTVKLDKYVAIAGGIYVLLLLLFTIMVIYYKLKNNN